MSTHAGTGRGLVSIGLPVYDGGKYLEETLDSILAQTYSEFELVISDNASTDRTEQICRAYAAKDPRIRYYRNKRNLGASKNFNRVFRLSSGLYFKWAAHDDLLAPNYLEKCVEVLEKDSSTVLCHSKTAYIDENGEPIETPEYADRGDSQKPHERFGSQLSFFKPSWKIFGLIRTDSLRKTSVMGAYIGGDRNLIAELSLIGRILEIPEFLFFARIHPQSYSYRFHRENRLLSNYDNRFIWWTENGQGAQSVFPHWKNCLEYFRAIGRAHLEWQERLLCYAEFFRWLVGEGIWVVGYNVYVALRSSCSMLHRFDVTALKLMTEFRERVVRAK